MPGWRTNKPQMLSRCGSGIERPSLKFSTSPAETNIPVSLAGHLDRLDASKFTRKYDGGQCLVFLLKIWRCSMSLVRSLLLGIGVALMLSSPADAAELKVGDKAPEFEMKGSDGKTYKLSQFKDKQAVVVAWYPKAFTGG